MAKQNALKKTSTTATRVIASTPPDATIATEPMTKALDLEDRIRERAHQIYLARDYQSGSDIEDWLHAEQAILLQEGTASAP
jgi:hypothetical protein